jgi:hypothetical protein
MITQQKSSDNELFNPKQIREQATVEAAHSAACGAIAVDTVACGTRSQIVDAQKPSLLARWTKPTAVCSFSPGTFLYRTVLPASWRGLAESEIRNVIRNSHDAQVQPTM